MVAEKQVLFNDQKNSHTCSHAGIKKTSSIYTDSHILPLCLSLPSNTIVAGRSSFAPNPSVATGEPVGGSWFIIHRGSQTSRGRQPQARWDEAALFIMHWISDFKTRKANAGCSVIFVRAVNVGY